MARSAVIKIEMPVSLRQIKLPKAVDNRLQNLLDRQDRGEKLTAAERKEAEGLVELVEMLSLLRIRSERAARASYVMSHIPLFLRKLVVRRAENRCEYCQLSQKGQEATFHIDHIIPVASGGETTAENLALACVSCSLRKGAKETATDILTGKEIKIFHPRNDDWNEHFEWNETILKGKTAKGRATINLLNLNRRLILAIREEEILLGRHPYNKK